MADKRHILRFVQSHKGLDDFDYSIAVYWAKTLISKCSESSNVQMLASFTLPINPFEIRPYLTSVLNEMGLQEFDGREATISAIYFHVVEIINKESITSVREHLRSLNKLCMDNGYDSELFNFYVLNHEWEELEQMGDSFYGGESNSSLMIELKEEAKRWMRVNMTE